MKKYIILLVITLSLLLTLNPVSALINNGVDTTNTTVTIQSGDMTLSNIITDLTFNLLSITGSTASTVNNNTVDMTITDYRGTHSGWTLNGQFSDFTNTTNVGYTLGGSGYISAFTKKSPIVKMNGTAAPTLNNSVINIFNTMDASFPEFEFATVSGESGAGDVTLRIPTDMFQLVLTDKTRAGNYTGTLTFNLVNGP